MNQFAKKLKLTNGLTVIFERNTAADVVSLNIGVKVGSLHETDDESGICHLIEHMVFKGTKSYKPGEISTLVESSGGDLNAYTSFDQTVYYINLPARHFGLGVNLLKEMVFDAAFDSEELEREKEVVVEEIRRGNDNPQRVLSEMLFSNHYKVHPYRRPVIGTESHVRGFSRDKIHSFYRHWYQPKNMVLGICGNVSEDELSRVLEDLFRFEVSAPELHQDFPVEALRDTYKVITKGIDIQTTYFDISFQAPSIQHDDVPALDVLSHLLGEGSTSLLEQNTKEREQLIHYVYSSNYTPREPGLFMIGGMVDFKKINATFLSIREQIETVKTELFASEKLERVKTLLRAQSIFEKETCEGTARKWMSYETVLGDYQYDEKYFELVSKLTPEDLRRVAKKYLDVTKSLVVILHPKAAKIKIDTAFFKPFKPKTVAVKKNKVTSYQDVTVYKLQNGMRVILRPSKRLPILSLRLVSHGGLRTESVKNNGISNLMATCLTKGTKTLSQLQLAEKVEVLAAHLSGYSGRNSSGASFSVLSEKSKEALPLFFDVVGSPAFEPGEVEKEKRQQLEAIKNRDDNPSQTVFRLAMAEMFKGHAYALNALGEKSVVQKFTPKNLQTRYAEQFVPNNLVLSVTGDYDDDRLFGFLNDTFGALKGKAYKPVKLPTPKPLKKFTAIYRPKEKEQAHVVLGFLSTSIYDKDRYVLDVIHAILSGMGGRLFLDLRDKQSLAYTVTSTTLEGLDGGFFGGYIGTEPSKVGAALRGMTGHFQNLITTPVPSVELERAKNYILGNHLIDNQKSGAIAMQVALNELYGIGVKEFFEFQKKILAVTPKDIQRVAKRFFDLDRCVLTVVGPKEAERQMKSWR